MFDVILVSHGPLARAMLKSAELLCGEQNGIKTYGLHHGDSIDAFEERVIAGVDESLSRGELVVLTDMMLGSPFNVTCRAMQGRHFFHITGMNLPMVTQLLMDRAGMGAGEAVAALMEASAGTIVNVNELLGDVLDVE